MKQAIILAGGKGTRLQERLNGLPKPLVDICGKPLLERQIESLKSYGFNQILILVNHGADQIIQFCNSKDNWNLDIQCLDDGQPLGTAGATIQILPKLADEFLVVYGDTMFDIDAAVIEDWLHNPHAVRITYPNVAEILVQWLKDGMPAINAEFAERVWEGVDVLAVNAA